MTYVVLSQLALALAALCCLLFLVNLYCFRRPSPAVFSRTTAASSGVSVLIPARNEAASIGGAVRAALDAATSVAGGRVCDCPVEVVVLDDGSTDATPHIVEMLSTHDGRVRLASAPPLPPGWCGKQHACHVLSTLARYEVLCFIDADVRLQPGSLAAMVSYLQRTDAALVSGFPRQETKTCLEWLLLPLIHLLLLGYLPIPWMRRSRSPAYGAGCGQLFLARRTAYVAAGGHASIRSSLHDGVTLPRAFRRAGFLTDIFDATALASCRMYRSSSEVWYGLAKNATEGLAQPVAILPWSVLLLGGHVLPFVLLAYGLPSGEFGAGFAFSSAAVAASWLPRWLAAARFGQSPVSALWHPVGITVLMTLQWYALLGLLPVGRRAGRGETIAQTGSALTLTATTAPNGTPRRPLGETRRLGSRETTHPRAREKLWRIAACGNPVALVVFAGVFASFPLLMIGSGRGSSEPSFLRPSMPPSAPARVVLVVVDALPVRATTPAAMPRLARLAATGGRGLARVDSLVASTVAGVKVLATGRVPAPASFLQDFGAGAARDGGVFAEVRRAGRRSFVAGPHLWDDLYGEWIDTSVAVDTLHHDDERVLSATLEALAAAKHDFYVVHFGRCDDLGHKFGTESTEFAEGVAWCDVAIGRIAQAIGEESAFLVTSDHGVTTTGGHAGPEPEVLQTPLVVAGAALPRGELGTVAQSSIHSTVVELLGVDVPEGRRNAPTVASVWWGRIYVLGVAPLAVLAALVLLAQVSRGRGGEGAVWMDACLWVSIACGFLWHPLVGAGVAVAGLLWPLRLRFAVSWRGVAVMCFMGVALGFLRWTTAHPGLAWKWGDGATVSGVVAGAFVALVVLRLRPSGLATGRRAERRTPGWGDVLLLLGLSASALALGGKWLLAVAIVSWIFGWSLAGWTTPQRTSWSATLVLFLAPAIAGLVGESVSLSTIDVHLAFDIVDGPFGVAGAAAVVMARHAFPLLPFLCGLGLRWFRTTSVPMTARFWASTAAVCVGEASYALLAMHVSSSTAGIALALGLLVRVAGDVAVLFLGGSLLTLLGNGVGRRRAA